MEYIESELAKRKSAASSIAGTSVGPSSEATGAAQNMPHDTPKPITQQGKLMEIDLGDDVRNRNEAMTDLARRRLQGERIQDEQPPKPKKARLGRDGKPWRPRNRRDSDAIKRDQLVEDILRENRCELTLFQLMNLPVFPADLA